MVCVYFSPSVGGLEVFTENLARQFVNMGHEVAVITNTPNHQEDHFPFRVLRNPTKKEVLDAYKWCDVFVHQTISLKYIWPLVLHRKPFFVVFHQVHWQKGIKGMLKRTVSHFSNNICVSNATAKGYGLKGATVIWNPYNSDIFKQTNLGSRRDIAFVGRLQKGKGPYLLIEAFSEFKNRTHSDYHLNFIGDSSERPDIENFARLSRHSDCIHFLGMLTQQQTSGALNQHHILAVTSTHPYYEAFGIVCLEGLACGCVVVGADGDGIEEALHGNGILYKNGDKQSLVDALTKAAATPSRTSSATEEWLRSRHVDCVAEEYIAKFLDKAPENGNSEN